MEPSLWDRQLDRDKVVHLRDQPLWNQQIKVFHMKQEHETSFKEEARSGAEQSIDSTDSRQRRHAAGRGVAKHKTLEAYIKRAAVQRNA